MLMNPDTFLSTLIFSLRSCTSVSFCRAIQACVVKSLDYRDGFIGDQLVSCYSSLGRADDARNLFDELPHKDLVSWNSLISGFSRRGYVDKCLNAFFRMKFEMGIQPNEVTLMSIISACASRGAVVEGMYIHGSAFKLGVLWEVKLVNSLINFYGKSGSLDEVFRLVETMPIANVVSWNLMIAIHTENRSAADGVAYFNLMRRSGIDPDDGTVVSLLQACENLGLRKLSECIHGMIMKCGLNEIVTIATGLLDLYAKLGRLNYSLKIFGEINNPDKVAWTAMLAAYAVHGYGREAMKLFENMLKEGVEPDHVTFTHLLSACSHSGLVEEGKNYFNIMPQVYGVEPRLDHYSCMVDLLGRSGLLNDAYELIRHMPMEPNSGVWGALFGACRVYGNSQLGKEVAERLFSLDPSDSRNYIMLSNMYSAAGLWRNASKVRALMKDKGLIRNPGCSFIEHGNKIHRFVVGDQSHPDSDKIYTKLEEVIGKIREAGFVSETECVLHDVEEEVKEDMISKHSEKLAIAFGLLVTNAGSPIIITKNLRICGDCHSTAKFISLIEKRSIIVRDSKRFHHFETGICSCGDYW
ncbi:pentatricopeptide repeat-containing protein [Pyrus ussuriensis x Pyrus communis]|uniref:Pentatricopeptide repeat-containing protein n=1 Tax=Pyrus ussuriensis x Pyrus communis TaxID=2448454 RepID=A0A5N5FKK3_9ROSA|nr:pentatricopeptide repeat-containing protein [Pyrus ussuriensis x Pyrus communis]